MILPDTDIQNATVLANRIIKELSSQTINIDGQDLNFTASAGVTALASDDVNSDAAMVRADNALYLAKKNGRNRVETNMKN